MSIPEKNKASFCCFIPGNFAVIFFLVVVNDCPWYSQYHFAAHVYV